ncbi:hypothetical protein [Bradyrhizobium diazoefficiens]|uniref:hypothetical protein n=1 Tax=Bradyrhizobium diazoefficiens TaxID=1355477 RepID=UPI001178AD1A|nr:hypothetical protein [Bradyrhizobium diazoefficiens]
MTKIQGRRAIRQQQLQPIFMGAPNSGPSRPNSPIRLWSHGDHAENTTLGKLQRAYLRTLDAVDQVDARKRSAEASGKLTPAGIADDVRGFTLENLVPDYQNSRKTIAAAKQEAVTLKDSIKLEPTDRADMVGFLRRQEMRQHLKAMPAKERNAFISKHREDMDPEMALAIVEMPSAFSGVLNGDRTHFVERALRAQHAEKMEQLTLLEDAIATAESAMNAGAEELRAEAGFTTKSEFERAVEQVRPREYQPWLKKVIEDGKEVVRVVRWDSSAKMTGSWPLATADELSRGQYFDNREAYDHANAGAAT